VYLTDTGLETRYLALCIREKLDRRPDIICCLFERNWTGDKISYVVYSRDTGLETRYPVLYIRETLIGLETRYSMSCILETGLNTRYPALYTRETLGGRPDILCCIFERDWTGDQMSCVVYSRDIGLQTRYHVLHIPETLIGLETRYSMLCILETGLTPDILRYKLERHWAGDQISCVVYSRDIGLQTSYHVLYIRETLDWRPDILIEPLRVFLSAGKCRNSVSYQATTNCFHITSN
jgi:hypothetical protein